MRWKKSKANLKLRPVSNPSPRAGSEEKNRNEGSGLTNYIVNKINRENKNVRTMKVGAYYALLFLHGGRNTCCLFYSVEFDSLQQITASRSKKENHVSASRNFPSLFFLLSLSFLFLFFFLFLFLDRSSVQFLVSGQLVQLYVEIRSNRKLIVVQIFHFPRVMCLFFFFHIFLFCGIFRINELIFISFDQWPDFKGVSTIVIPDVITSAQIPASLLL